MKNSADPRSVNPRYLGKTVGEIARLVFKPKHDRVPVAKPVKKKAKDSKGRE